jgi:hypothetical protein
MTDIGVLTASDERALVAALTAGTLSEVAPEEIPSFEADRDVYLDGGQPRAASRVDRQLGIGLEIAVMLTPAVVAAARAVVRILAEALADSAVSETKAAVAAWVHHVLHPGKAAAPASAFSSQEFALIRTTVLKVCRQMRTDDGDAELIADALIGRLATAAGPSAPA